MAACFHFTAPSIGKTAVVQRSTRLVCLQHNDALCDRSAGQTLCGYSHQCRPTLGCQRGLAARAGPEVQVDLAETDRKAFSDMTSKKKLLLGFANIGAWSNKIIRQVLEYTWDINTWNVSNRWIIQLYKIYFWQPFCVQCWNYKMWSGNVAPLPALQIQGSKALTSIRMTLHYTDN